MPPSPPTYIPNPSPSGGGGGGYSLPALRSDQVFKVAAGRKNSNGVYAGYVILDIADMQLLQGYGGDIVITFDGSIPKCGGSSSPSSVSIAAVQTHHLFAFCNSFSDPTVPNDRDVLLYNTMRVAYFP